MSFEDMIRYCERHATGIYVRTKRNGEWGNVAIAELPFAVVMEYINEWHARSHTPVVVVEQS